MVESLINYYDGGNKAQFANRLGLRPQTISSWIKRNSYDAEIIFAKCEDVSAEWLLSCEGDMLRHSQNAEDINKELLHLCQEIVSNYQQRDKVISQLVSVVNSIQY